MGVAKKKGVAKEVTVAYVSVRVIILQDAYGKLDTVPKFIKLCTIMACNK